MKKIRWGIMGTGRIANVFCDMLRNLEQAEIYAVGSRDFEKASLFGKKYQVKHCYGSYEGLATDEKIDIIYVATPITCHYHNVKLCLESGKHVLCEKAFTQSVEQARELYELSKRKQLFLMEALWTKCQPTFRKIMQWNQEGKLGQIQAVDAKFYTMGNSEHRLIKYKNQGGVLYDLSIYPLMYACALLGYSPKTIHALAVMGGDNIDITNSIQLQYENGAIATLTSGVAHERQVSLYIQGTKGRILISNEFFFCAQHVELVDWNNNLIEQFDGIFSVNGYEYEAIEAMNCIWERKTQSQLIPMDHTIAILGILEKCKNSYSENDKN